MTSGNEAWRLPDPYGYEADWPLLSNERRMFQLRYALLCKPEWQRKVLDPQIRAAWKREALSEIIPLPDIVEVREQDEHILYLTDEQVESVLDELAWLARKFPVGADFQPSAWFSMYESSTLLGQDAQIEFQKAIQALERQIPDSKKDWHPGTNEQVLNLVHPSLYPLCYGRTTVVAGDGSLQLAQVPEKLRASDFDAGTYRSVTTSQKFCWLPADFRVNSDGAVRTVSCINNLEPFEHHPIYTHIEHVIERVLPMWELCLAEAAQPRPRVLFFDRPSDVWYVAEPEFDWEKEAEEAGWDVAEEQYEALRKLRPILPRPFDPKDIERDARPLRDRTLQIIVKLANIHLTPQKPEYPGGTWHLEGMSNEAIVASAIWYFDKENVKDDSLVFRKAFGHEDHDFYNQSDDRAMEAVFGLDATEASASQIVANVPTTSNKVLVWPNMLQHRPSSFKLDDPTKPGHRKILAMFLVNPDERITSTSDVPPQQIDWFERAIDRTFEEARLPPEIWAKVVEQANLMTLDGAKEIRLELMKERTRYVEASNENKYEALFNMCEH